LIARTRGVRDRRPADGSWLGPDGAWTCADGVVTGEDGETGWYEPDLGELVWEGVRYVMPPPP
jgi:hypothetical protein